MGDKEEVELQAFPAAIAASVQHPDAEKLTQVVWSELQLNKIHQPFQLPVATGSYNNLSHFVETEIMLQTEIMRSNINDKICMVGRMPKGATEHKKAEKHLKFVLPSNVTGGVLSLAMDCIHKEPSRGMFTNYVFVFQRVVGGGEMQNICLAYCKQLQKKNGAIFALGKDASRLHNMTAGTIIYARPLVNCNMWKTHLRAIAALKEAETRLNNSYVTKQLLGGRIDTQDMKTMEDIDVWIQSKSGGDSSVSLQTFNKQQQRSLALDALTTRGFVLIQGPPGTGKSHIICHGLLPHGVTRNERVLVICNSNIAVDALMLKCWDGNVASVKDNMRRCGFKESVDDRVVNLDLYLEGDISSAVHDRYGNTPGSNSNTQDSAVQTQIRSAQVIFTTIHFASKEKGGSHLANNDYWKFDTLVLDEAAQIEDAKLMIVLARCPSLKKMILVGDPKQLQPYVPDSLRDQRYGMSTMERVMDASGGDPNSAPHIMLEQQFRMAPSLRSVVSHLYYNDRLRDDESVNNNGPDAKKVDLKPLLVVNVTGTIMEYSRMHHSYENVGEASVVKVIYNFLFSSDIEDALPLGDEGLTSNDVCILTPYNRHKDRLRMKVCNVDEDALDSYAGQTFSSRNQTTPVKSGSDARSNRYSSTPLRSPPKKSQAIFGSQEEVDDETAARVENIDTVDKFQGSQRKVVMISTCVVGKPRRASDPHFINVACSRSQHLLIIVGNFTNGLAGNSDWQYV